MLKRLNGNFQINQRTLKMLDTECLTFFIERIANKTGGGKRKTGNLLGCPAVETANYHTVTSPAIGLSIILLTASGVL